jgi:PAS domain S-box-containing protein
VDSPVEILDALPDAVLVVEAGAVARTNAAARTAFGAGIELAGRAFAELLAPGELARFELLDAQRARGWPQPSACRLRFLRPDGTSLLAEVSWSRLPSSAMILTARDVTAATRAEDLIGRLAQLPSGLDGTGALFDASERVFLALDWVVALTELGEDESIVLRVVAAPGSPLGAHGRSLLGRRMPMRATPILAEVLRRGEAIFLDNLPTTFVGGVAEAVALSDDMDRARIVRSAWCPVRTHDRITHVLSVAGSDMTEHDFVAVQLFAAQVGAAERLGQLRIEMIRRERLAAVGEMAAVLAHEVRNPLGIMFNAVGTLERLDAAPSPEQRALLEILRQEADRLKRLVTDLLDFASTSAASLEPTALSAVVDEAVRAARHDPSFAGSGRTPALEVRVPADVFVLTDATLLRRALLNVLVNAFQHAPPEGQVVVGVERRGVDPVVLSVWNDGPPISETVAKRMFEPFYTTKPTGTGLGLAIVRRICADLQATIALAPSPRGVLFELALPPAPPP